ncbi:hypothetical protein BH11PSE13_BH11PSE13_12520 [soil metagenome]
MTTVTLQDIEARHAEVAKMIEQFRTHAAAAVFIAEIVIALQPGERYAGAVLNDDGSIKHHLVLMAGRPAKKLAWQAAMNWAAEVGGQLPDRQEQALLFANCKPHLEAAWHWSSQVHESDASDAWNCDFSDGHQSSNHKSYEGSAVAVRRIS